MQNSAKQLLTLRWIQPCVGCYHLHPPSPFSTVLITSKADTHRTIPWRIGGWVNLGTAIHSYLQWDLISCTAVMVRHFTTRPLHGNVIVWWQASCHCGFVIDAGMVGQAKIICPNCDHAMCQLCKKVVSTVLKIIISSCFNLVLKNNVLLV